MCMSVFKCLCVCYVAQWVGVTGVHVCVFESESMSVSVISTT